MGGCAYAGVTPVRGGGAAAGASRVSVNIVLAVLILSLLLFIYKTVRDGALRLPDV